MTFKFIGSRPAASGLFLLATALLPGTAGATERRFTYLYQSGVLAEGDVELEPWTTFRGGRAGYFNGYDQRVEVEAGLGNGLQTSFYLNFSGAAEGTGLNRQQSVSFDGVSSEWKLKLSDPVADALGSAAYFEALIGPGEIELEAKAILDKRLGDLTLAFNLVGEYEWELNSGEEEVKVELVGGLSYNFAPSWSAGVEIRSLNEIPTASGWENSIFYAGPVVTYATHKWWATVTVLPQIAALKGADTGSLFLADHERIEARLVFGVHL